MGTRRRVKVLLVAVVVVLSLACVLDIVVVYWLPPLPNSTEWAAGRESDAKSTPEALPATPEMNGLGVRSGGRFDVFGMVLDGGSVPPGGSRPFYARVTGSTQESFDFGSLEWDGGGWSGVASQRHASYGEIHASLRITADGSDYRAEFVEMEGRMAATLRLSGPAKPWDRSPRWINDDLDAAYWGLATTSDGALR